MDKAFDPSNLDDRRFAGRKAVLLARASTTKQTVSVPDQLAHMRRFTEAHDITVIGEVAHAGLSGSKPWARDDIDEILGRKRQGDGRRFG